MIIERDLLIDNNCFDERLMSSQDYDMWLKYQKMKVRIIDKVLGEYIENLMGLLQVLFHFRALDQLTIAMRYKHYVSYSHFIL